MEPVSEEEPALCTGWFAKDPSLLSAACEGAKSREKGRERDVHAAHIEK